jgi:steroid 5-alpha reductase family enzyme
MFAQAIPLLLTGAAVVCSMMLALWVVHLLIRNAAVVDVGWAAGLGLLALYYAYAGPGYSARK